MNEEEMKEMDNESMNLHKVWHGLCDHLKRYYYTKERLLLWGKVKKLKEGEHTKEKYEACKSKKEIKVLDFKQVKGYDAMSAIRKYVDKHPEIVECHTDDDWHTNSAIFLIPHETDKKYMGTTVLNVPQCSSDNNLFFLYPSDLDNLIKELQKIQARQMEKNAEDYKYLAELEQEMEDERAKHEETDN